MATSLPDHLYRLEANATEVERLAQIHSELVGSNPGRKHGVEVLHKSAIVLLVACWEDYIEELARNSFDAIMAKARRPDVFPNRVLALAVKSMHQGQNPLDLWGLAGDGWKKIIENHRVDVFEEHTGTFNTPKPDPIDSLFQNLIGLKHLSNYWSWPGMSCERSRKKLIKLVELRGDIAHKVATDQSVTKTQVEGFVHFIKRIAAISSNQAGLFVARRVRRRPWPVNLVYVGHRNK